jgi:hypothetical protein
MEVNGQLHAPAALTPKERAPGIHWTGGLVGPRAGGGGGGSKVVLVLN